MLIYLVGTTAQLVGGLLSDRGWTREWVRQIVDKAPPGTVLVWDPDYGMFNADANRLAHALQALGVGRGERGRRQAGQGR